MAATKLHGYVLVYFAAHEHHIGLYPAPVEDRISPVTFPPMPLAEAPSVSPTTSPSPWT